MPKARQIMATRAGVPRAAVLALAAVFAAGLFAIGFDNGQIVNAILSTAGSAGGIDPMVIHEFTHDMRHAAGFPCH